MKLCKSNVGKKYIAINSNETLKVEYQVTNDTFFDGMRNQEQYGFDIISTQCYIPEIDGWMEIEVTGKMVFVVSKLIEGDL